MATEIAMLQALETLERDQQGLATTNGLLALVNGLRDAARDARRSCSSRRGWCSPSAWSPLWRASISEANRGGVSFYAADAAGLRVRSARRRDAARARAPSPTSIGSATETRQHARRDSSAMTRLMERNEDVLRFDPASGLGALARETGGFLIRDTNDIALGLRRVEEELGSYYLLSYAPNNETWDGRYRRIELRARRSGAHRAGPPRLLRGAHADADAACSTTRRRRSRGSSGPRRRPSCRSAARALQFPGEDGESDRRASSRSCRGPRRASVPDKAGRTLSQDFTLLCAGARRERAASCTSRAAATRCSGRSRRSPR